MREECFQFDSTKHHMFSLGIPPVETLDQVCCGDPYWTSRKNILELIELSSINKVSLI